ncbi:MAG: GIY-YIG nuclease family protein [Bacteroidales bacterium]|nr:GIY-YIG nuclease family protein [Bacteroidales bacterium]
MSEKSGNIYIMYCPDKPLKIGRSIDTERRNKELNQAKRTTSLDVIDYVIAYDFFVDNCVEMEQLIHKKLDYCRFNNKRELFTISLKEAIQTVNKIITDEQNKPKIDFTTPAEPDYKIKWNNLNFNIRQLIKNQINLNNNITDNELIDCLRNLIDFSQDKNEKKLVLELYKQINYRDNLRKWFNELPKNQKQLINSFTNRQLTDNEFNEILNLKNFDCRERDFVTEIKPLTILKNLETLNLSHTKIDDLHGIENFQNLRELHFNQTNVKSLKPLLKLKKLKTVHCIGSKIDKKDIDYFYEFRKDCEIINKSFMDNAK